MRAVVLAVLAIFFFCAFAQKKNDSECQKIRERLKALEETVEPGKLAGNLAKRSEYRKRLSALGCPLSKKPKTRETERPICKEIRDKLRNAMKKVPRDQQSLDPTIADIKKQLDSNRCAKRAFVPPERKNEDPECELFRTNIRQLRATTGDADKEEREKKINEWKERMNAKKCVEIWKPNAQCEPIREQIRNLRKNVLPGEREAVEKKVSELILRLEALACRKPLRNPLTRETENAECPVLRSKIRVARLTIKDKTELETKTNDYKKRLDALRCVKRAVTPPERKNEDPECENIRGKIRQIRATSPSSADKDAVEKKVREYKTRLNQLKCVRLREDQPARGRCYVAGCNRELCTDRPGIVSPCWYKPEFKCYKNAKCGPYGRNGSCSWEKTPEFYQCLNEAKGGLTK